VQVRDLSILDEAFRDALDGLSGGQVCTKLTQLRLYILGNSWTALTSDRNTGIGVVQHDHRLRHAQQRQDGPAAGGTAAAGAGRADARAAVPVISLTTQIDHHRSGGERSDRDFTDWYASAIAALLPHARSLGLRVPLRGKRTPPSGHSRSGPRANVRLIDMYYSCCFPFCDRVAAKRGLAVRRDGYVVSPPSGRRGSGGEGCQAGAVVVPAGACLVPSAPC
jgi:hypothetical protein